MKLIQRSAELHPIGLAGFQYGLQEPQPGNPEPGAAACAVPTRVRAIALAGIRLNVTAEALPVHLACPPDGLSVHPGPSQANREKVLQQRVSELVAGLRADIERRRQDGANSQLHRGPAPRVVLQSVLRASA